MLINCVVYRQGQRLSDISLDELHWRFRRAGWL